MRNLYLLGMILLLPYTMKATDEILVSSIQSVKLFKIGNQTAYPIINLGTGDQLELVFDDLDADIKNFYYSFQLCEADWSPSVLQPFDYIKGFQSVRINNYRKSSISFTPYTNYQAMIPDRNMSITRSGNYLLKVFINNDTSALFFTKRFLVVDNKISISTQMKLPFNTAQSLTHQRLLISLSTANADINVLSPQDIKLVALQNNNWQTAVLTNKPNIYRGDFYEYNDDKFVFPAGREWRWIDLRSVRLLSERVDKLDYDNNIPIIFIKPDAERRGLNYIYYKDINGMYTLNNADGNNPYWQSDYAYTIFTYVPPGNKPYPQDLYVTGELANWNLDENSKMVFDEEQGVYQKMLFLKQGYYNYMYVSANKNGDNITSLANTEGNFTVTENEYTILVYYRSFGSRSDELIGMSKVNSLNIY